jgi:hypothetical protein
MGKSFGGPYAQDNVYFAKDNRINAPNEPDAFLDALNEFYEKHCWCKEKPSKRYKDYCEPKWEKREPNHYENRFEIAYETDYDTPHEWDKESA